ncbi:PQQ-like beta-propeller repeat protein [Candidatus Poribacteria bacterium]|nr:PQQ-like beta-propeller repeat protein [Candidatus Poribacteria bacterium]
MTFCFLSGLSPLISAFVTTGDWPMWRHDAHLTAYQPLSGAMKTSPEVLARYFLGAGTGAVTPADLSGTGTAQEFLIVARARLFAYDAQGQKLWECNPSIPPGLLIVDCRLSIENLYNQQSSIINHQSRYWLQQVAYVADLDGDGRNEVVALAGHLGGTRWAFLILDGQTGHLRASFAFNQGQFGYSQFCGAFVSGKPGQQILLVTSGKQAPPQFPPSTGGGKGGWETHGHIMLLQFDGETISPLWDFEPTEYAIEYPATLIGDLMGRGRLHAVVDSWCHVWNVDLSTGELVSHTTWNPEGANQRHYGWNQLVDVFGDGRLDFVNVSLTKHVDVLCCDENGKLSLAWTNGWPDPVTTEARSLVCPVDPIADVDGDGRKELVVGVFDGLVDNRWHLYAYDGATGELKAEALDLVPLASVSLRDSGGDIMFCARSTTNVREPGEGYEVWHIRAGQWEQLWVSTDAPFLLTAVPSEERLAVGFNGLNVRRAVTADVDGDGRMEFFTQQQGIVQAWGLDDAGKIVKKPGQPPAAAPGPQLPPLPQLQGRMATYLLAADVRRSGRNHLLLYDNTNVTALILEGDSPVARDEGLNLRRGFIFQSLELPIVCQLLGDERQFILVAGRESDQNLFIEARQLQPDATDSSSILWHFTLKDSQGCGQYLQAIYFIVGHFTGGPHFDVFTYSTKPGARAYVLDGRTGQPLWERQEIPGIERHFQAMGGRTAVWDYDNDGEDDLLFCCPDYYCVADGKTGELHVGPVFLPDITGRWAAYSSPTVLTQEGQPPIIYLGGAYESRTSIQPDGKKGLWSEFLSTDQWRFAASSYHHFSEGLLPPCGERGWRVVMAQVDGKLICFDATTGQHTWEISLTTAPSAIVTGDVDGDGRDEFLFGGQDGNLYVYRDVGDHPEEVWRKGFDGPVGTPLLADINGDGRSEIIVSIGDGNVVVLG